MRDHRIVGIAQLATCRAPEQLACLGLGSCVAVILYDPVPKIGGIVHALLPKAPAKCTVEEKYADAGTRKLVRELIARGAVKERLLAKLVGGAQMFANLNLSISDIGKANCAEARKALRELGIRVIAEDVEGHRGRSAYFNLENGKVLVETAFSPSKTI
jgi:chemotaxis protein CheD